MPESLSQMLQQALERALELESTLTACQARNTELVEENRRLRQSGQSLGPHAMINGTTYSLSPHLLQFPGGAQ